MFDWLRSLLGDKSCKKSAPPADQVALASTDAKAPTDHSSASQDLAGIDVSHFQGAVDWSEVAKSGVGYAYAKATDGTSFVDPDFASNWAAMGAAGIARGAYLFFRFGESVPEQLANFTRTVTLSPGDLPPMVDVETSNGDTATENIRDSDLQQLLDGLSSHYNVKPFIYTGPSFWNSNLGTSFGGYPLWIAEYGVSAPRIPNGWTDYTFWQHSQSGNVSGVPGHVDLDTFKGSPEALKSFAMA